MPGAGDPVITLADAQVQQFDSQFYVEHLSHNRFAGDMGPSDNNLIHVKEQLATQPGESISYNLVNRLKGDGVTGNTLLEGKEEEMDQRSHVVKIEERGHAVVVPDREEQFSPIALRRAAKSELRRWADENVKNRIIDALGMIDGVSYDVAGPGQRNAWLAANADRVLFGRSKGNTTASHATSMANVGAADNLNSSVVTLLKRMAKMATPKIVPQKSEAGSGRDFFTLYVHPLTFRDLENDVEIKEAQQSVSSRMQNEKLFKGGDMEWRGIIIKEVDDLPIYENVGAGGIDVAPAYLCGVQALGYAVNRRFSTREKTFDYGRKKGCAVIAFDGIDKLQFGTGAADRDGLKDNGVVTAFLPAIGDA